MGQALNENRNGLIVGVSVTEANGTAERTAALEMVDELKTKYGYRLSQKCRQKIVELFGWWKGVVRAGRSRLMGRWKRKQTLELAAVAYNLIRLRKLAPAG